MLQPFETAIVKTHGSISRWIETLIYIWTGSDPDTAGQDVDAAAIQSPQQVEVIIRD